MFDTGCIERFLICWLFAAASVAAPVPAMAARSVVPLLVIDGEAADDMLGQWTSPLGDINNDGYDDFVVVAPKNDAGGSNAGRAYIYLGGPGLDAVPDLVFTGPAAHGYIVCTAPIGDVNEDGFDDFLIGARGEGRSYIGKGYLFYGGSTPDVVPDLILTGEQTGDAFGCNLAGLGDINADGHDDFIIYAPWYNHSLGRGYLFFGGPGLDTSPDVIINNPKGEGEFGCGTNPSFRGQDLNGDGYNDLLACAYKSDFGGFDSGGGWIYYGGPGFDTTPDLAIGGEESPDWMSGGAALGDINSDGYEDFALGATMPYKSGGKGKVYLFLGGPGIDAVADMTVEGEATGDACGIIEGIGDVDLDGFPDFIICAPRNDEGGVDAGKVYIYFGRSWQCLDGSADIELLGEASGDKFGYYPSPVGDVDGNGRPEFAVAAMFSDANGIDAGRVHVYTICGTADSGDVEVALECPPDIIIPPFWDIPTLEIDGLAITNTGTTPQAYDYHAAIQGRASLSNPYAGTTPTLAPGETYTAPNATVIINTGIQTYSHAWITYHVSEAGSPSIEKCCTCTITFEPPVSVEITAFEAEETGSGIRLSWSVYTNESIRGFQILRRTGAQQTAGPLNPNKLIPRDARTYLDTNVQRGETYEYSLVVIGEDGTQIHSHTATLTIAPYTLSLRQNRPNPFNPLTRIDFVLDRESPVRLLVFDISGRLIRTLTDRRMASGPHSVEWDGRDDDGLAVTSGVYFYRLKVGNRSITRKAVVLK